MEKVELYKRAKQALERRFGQALSVTYDWHTNGNCLTATDDETGSWVRFYVPTGSKRGRVIAEHDGAANVA